ncbi:MAG TPA: hypothetical protein VGS80_18915, partial [Ktedonobacterales bacterium]|nr:hypothetical protein [Ktedonobacterales bacterium]
PTTTAGVGAPWPRGWRRGWDAPSRARAAGSPGSGARPRPAPQSPRPAVPRPRPAVADPQAQEACKNPVRPLVRAVATACPQATVALWARDAQRMGRKPRHAPGRATWRWAAPARPGAAPLGLAVARRRRPHPASGRTVFPLASALSRRLFAPQWAACAEQVGAGPTKPIIGVLDHAGWHAGIPRPRGGCPTTSTGCFCRPPRPRAHRPTTCGR